MPWPPGNSEFYLETLGVTGYKIKAILWILKLLLVLLLFFLPLLSLYLNFAYDLIFKILFVFILWFTYNPFGMRCSKKNEHCLLHCQYCLAGRDRQGLGMGLEPGVSDEWRMEKASQREGTDHYIAVGTVSKTSGPKKCHMFVFFKINLKWAWSHYLPGWQDNRSSCSCVCLSPNYIDSCENLGFPWSQETGGGAQSLSFSLTLWGLVLDHPTGTAPLRGPPQAWA